MDSRKRKRIGLISSFIFHGVLVLILAVSGLFNLQRHDEDIVEVAFFGGGGGGGAIEESAPEEQPQEETVEEQPQEEAVEEVQPDSILQHEDTAKKIVPKKTAASQPKKSSGAGEGTGTGSGKGSGSGNGVGNGHGDGIGDGNAPTYQPAIPPRIIRQRQPVYPAAERNAKIEGTTIIRFLIGTSGEVEEVIVVASSGNAALDNAAVNAGYKWKFTAAKNGSGRPIRCYANLPITFQLRK